MKLDLNKIKIDSLVPESVEQPLRSTMAEAVKVKPADEVKVKKLSRASGMSMEAVKTDPQSVESSLNLEKINFDEMVEKNPKLSKYLTDYSNASIAHDDIENLSSLERALSPLTSVVSGITGTIGEAVSYADTTLENFPETSKIAFQLIGKGTELFTTEHDPLLELIKPILELGVDPESFKNIEAQKEIVSAGLIEDIDRLKEQRADLSPKDLTLVQEGIRSGLDSLAMMAPGFALTLLSGGSSTPMLMTIGAQTLATSYAEGRSEGLSPDTAQWYAGIDAAIEVGTEIMPVKTLEKILTGKSKGLTKDALQFLVKEMGTEQLATLGQSLNQYAFGIDEELKQAKTPQEMVDIQLRRQVITAIATVVAGGAQAGIVVGIRKTVDSFTQHNDGIKGKTNTEQNTIDSVNNSSEKSNLKKGDKESFREFTQGVNEDSDVFIDGAQTKLYLQTKTAEEIAADPGLQLLQKKVDEAAALGGDVTVPVADFATDITGTESYDALRDHMKLSPETSTPFRQEQEQQEAKNYVETLINEAQESASEYAESQEIFTSVRDQLIDTGRMTPQQASVMADIVPAWATVQAQTRGIPVSQVYQESGLHVEGPMTGEAARLSPEALEQKEMLDKVSQSDIFNIGETERRIEDDNYIHDRLPQGADTAQKGSTLESASTIARRSLRSVQPQESAGFPVAAGIKGRKQEAGNIRKAEADFLKKWAEQENLIISDFELRHQAAVQENDGIELGGRDNYVFLDEFGTKFMKANRFTYAPTFADLFDSIALHNEQFEDSKYTLEGFTEVKGEFLPVFSQANIIEDEGVTDEQLLEAAEEYLKSIGYTKTNPSEPTQTAEFVKGDIIVEDIHSGNVIISGGLTYIFDPIIRLNPATKAQRVIGRDIGGERQDIGEEEIDLEALGAVFEQAPDKDLFVAHNLSAENIIAAQDLGGLAAPSIAVARTGVSDFTGFGEVTLLAKPELLEGEKTRTFDADIYSPRQPRPVHDISIERFNSLIREINESMGDLDLDRPDFQTLEESNGADALLRSTAAEYHWLTKQGKAPTVKNEKVDPTIRKLDKLGLNEFAAIEDPKFIKIASEHYRNIIDKLSDKVPELQKGFTEKYFNEDGTLKSSKLRDLAFKVRHFRNSGGKDTHRLRGDIAKKMRVKKTRQEYEQWVKAQFDNVVEGKKLFKGFTPAGNRKYVEYNMLNVVKDMTSKLQGGETFFYGAGTVRSVYANELKSIKKVQAKREKIVSESDMEKIKEESAEVFQDALEKLKPFYKFDSDSFGYSDDAGNAIMEGPRGLRETFNVNDEVYQIVNDLTDYLASLPTSYFEAKIQRPVAFSEFDTAVVPKNIKPEALQILKDSGVKIKKYDPKTEGSRTEIIAKQQHLLFQKPQNGGAKGYYDPANSLIRLTESSDLSTFLHEFAHFMYDMELKNPGSQMTEKIHNWFKRNADDVAKEANGYVGKEGEPLEQVPVDDFSTIQGIEAKIRTFDSIDAAMGFFQDPKIKIDPKISQAFFDKYSDDGKLSPEKTMQNAMESLTQPDVPPTAPPTTGNITAADVVAYLDNKTSGDINKDKAIERAVHEQFARGFETYLMEGKAPSVELRNVFRTFARWLTQIYRAIQGDLRVNLDKEMRDVFARMIATEEQINAAEARAQFEPMFTDAAMAGMTEEEFQKYQEKQAKAKDKASETLRDKLIKQLTRQTEKWWREEKADIVEEEIERLKKEKVYVAKDTLLTGEFKLDRPTVKAMVGEERTDKLGRTTTRIPEALRNMTAAGGEGVHPDEAAGFLGYASGDEMVQAIIAAPTIKKVAEQNAEAQMVERHGDIMNDGTIEKEADEAVQNEERGKLILDELKTLSKGTGRAVIERQMLKTMAEENIGKLSFRNIHPGKYRKAEIRAAQESAAAFAKGNKEEAATAKARQALNFYLGKAATEAKSDTIKIVDRMARYRKKSVREAIMKAGSGYWEQLTKVLNRFEFRKAATLTQVDKLNENINAWAKVRIEEDGDALVLSPEVLDEGYVTHWKNVPYDALLGVNDSIKNIEHVARYSNKITLRDEEITFQKVVQRWTDSMNEKVTTRFKSQRTDVIEGKKWGRWAMAQMTKIPYMASWLDGQERVGLSHDILIQPLTNDYNDELKLFGKTGLPVVEAIHNRNKNDLKRHNTKRFIPAIKDADNDGNLFGHQILAVALNTGNESNLKKMLLGEGWANPEVEAEVSFNNPKLQAVLKHMTKSDWDLVQLIWGQMDQLYPQLAEVHRKTTGLTPPKIEATPIETEFGTFKGGYYPVKYDPNRSFRAEQNEDRLNAETESMFGRVGIQASVNASATSERTGYYAPIRLSLDVVPNHFQETIHYITHHDSIRQINKLIKNESVATTIKEKLGPEEYAQLKPWLNDIAKDGRETPLKTFIGSILQRLRFGTTLGVMGFKASTGIIQILGLSNTIAELGSGPVYQAIRSILGSTTTMQTAWDFAVDNSKVMEHRVNTMDREIKNAMQKIEGKRGILAAAQEASMKHIALIQTYMVDLPSWHAAYIKGMKDWGDEKRAYAYADWVIENVQGSGVTKDMAQIMRNQSQEMRMFTMFMTFFSSLWNMERDLVKGAKAGTYSRSSVAAKMMFLFAIPVFLDMLLRGDFGGDDDEDSKLQKYLTNTALYPVQSIPFVRDAASKLVSDYGYNISPIAQILDVGLTTLPELVTRPFTDEEVTKSQVKGATKFIGAATGVPGINQAWATGEHLYDVMVEGEELTLNQLLYGPRRR